MITIKTENHTYMSKINAEESEKLFRKILADILDIQEKIASVPENDKAVLEEDSAPEKEDVTESIDPVTEPEPLLYKGFLYIKCRNCGKEKAFCSKSPIREYTCEDCGEKTPLENLISLNTKCECGKYSRYHTNMEDYLFDVNCIACGSPVTVKFNKKKNQYETVV